MALLGGNNPQRNAKLRRLGDMRSRLPFVSQSALAAMCKMAKDDPESIPKISQPRNVRDARDLISCQQTPYGDMLERRVLVLRAGGTVPVMFANPLAMLYVAAKERHFADLLRRTAAAVPPSVGSPWDMCVYNDEITPGNVKKSVNERKLAGVYWSFLDFGPHACSKEDNWLVGTVVEYNVCQTLEGGMAQIVGALLKQCFNAALHHLTLSGVEVELDDGTLLRIFAKFSALLADEAALHATWLCKGAGGNKPCVQCQNICSATFFCESPHSLVAFL